MALHSGDILVSGGAGFIGSHLVDHLLECGYRVTVLDNFRNGRRENLPSDSSSDLNIVAGDVTDPKTCRDCCQNADLVFHLACLGVRHSLHDPVENHQVNALGTLNLLNAARESGVTRFIYVSSSEVYGATESFPITESTPTWPLTVYGASKLAGEHYARAYFECFGLPTVCVRPFNNYGPRSHFEGDSGEVLPRFIFRVLEGQPPVIFGDGEQTRDFLYVRDCVVALLEIASCEGLLGQVVNLGFGRELSINELAETVLAAMGRTDLRALHEPPRPADVPRLWADTTKLRKHVAFRPETELLAGIQHCLEYFEELHRSDPELGRHIKTRNWEP